VTEQTYNPNDREPQRFEVTLIKPHIHAGQDLEPGDTLRVTAEQRAWLIEAGVIENPTAETSKEK